MKEQDEKQNLEDEVASLVKVKEELLENRTWQPETPLPKLLVLKDRMMEDFPPLTDTAEWEVSGDINDISDLEKAVKSDSMITKYDKVVIILGITEVISTKVSKNACCSPVTCWLIKLLK